MLCPLLGFFFCCFFFLAERCTNWGHLAWQQRFKQTGAWEKKWKKKNPIKLWNYSSAGPNYFHLSASLQEWGESRRNNRTGETQKRLWRNSDFWNSTTPKNLSCGRCDGSAGLLDHRVTTIKAPCIPGNKTIHFHSKAKVVRWKVSFSPKGHVVFLGLMRSEFQAFLRNSDVFEIFQCKFPGLVGLEREQMFHLFFLFFYILFSFLFHSVKFTG